MKKILFVSLFFGLFAAVANAETVTAKVAATSYVQGAIETRLSALDPATTGTGNIVTNVTIDSTDTSNKKISLTKANVQIPVGSASATSYTPIWVE